MITDDQLVGAIQLFPMIDYEISTDFHRYNKFILCNKNAVHKY